MAFGLIPKVFDPINMRLASSKTLRMIDSDLMARGPIQRIAAGQRIAADNAIRQNPHFHDRQEGLPLCIGEITWA